MNNPSILDQETWCDVEGCMNYELTKNLGSKGWKKEGKEWLCPSCFSENRVVHP